MNALELIKKSDPKLYSQFLDAFSKDLGLEQTVFRCPNCNNSLQVTAGPVVSQLNSKEKKRPGRKPHLTVQRAKTRKTRGWRPRPNSLFQLLVDLARLRGTTTGVVNGDYSKMLKKSKKKLPPKEAKEAKIAWAKAEITKRKAA
jgi:hypothetical protein